MIIREAVRADLPAIVELLADDMPGNAREFAIVDDACPSVAGRQVPANLQPVTRCHECDYDWAGPPQQAAATITALPASVSRLLTGIGIADTSRQLRARSAAVMWSPLEYIAHTSDAIDWYAHRVNRTLTENRPTFEPFDWDAHTVSQRYHDRHLDDVLDDVNSSCARFTAMLVDLTAADWKREGTGSDGQPRTITQLVHRAAHEAQHHLRDIQIGLSASR